MMMYLAGIWHNTAIDPVRPAPFVYGRRNFAPDGAARPDSARPALSLAEEGGATDATGLGLPPEYVPEALAAFAREQTSRAAELAYREAGRHPGASREAFVAARGSPAGLAGQAGNIQDIVRRLQRFALGIHSFDPLALQVGHRRRA
jgi:hypothetical protein